MENDAIKARWYVKIVGTCATTVALIWAGIYNRIDFFCSLACCYVI